MGTELDDSRDNEAANQGDSEFNWKCKKYVEIPFIIFLFVISGKKLKPITINSEQKEKYYRK